MKIEAEDKVELRIESSIGRVPIELHCNSGDGRGGCERRVIGRGVAESDLICVQQNSRPLHVDEGAERGCLVG